MHQISLSSPWHFRLDEELAWRPIRVPGCWEMLGVRKDHAGPAWYRTHFTIPPEWAGKRHWLRFGAVSYYCEISVNGHAVGEHTGLWDSFAVEITGAVEPGTPAELLVRVEKPAGLVCGPSSEHLPGRFPLKETLSGFLPYVWGHIFGGIWQDVALAATGAAVFEHVYVWGAADGRLHIEAALSAPGPITLVVRDPDGAIVYEAGADAAEQVTFDTTLADPQPWSPDRPALYEVLLRAGDGDERVVRFGLRSLHADGTTILLNERPIYPRLALSWGWYPEALHSNPGPERVRADFARLRSLGYNGVKLCLWFPPRYYFDLADELGMLLWVELPMWLPQPGEHFRRQTPIEYARLMVLARNHPSVILYSLGCELGRAVGADILAPLYALVKAHAGDALVRDNSGSGEAYGGLLNEFADYYDYHFYAEPHFFRDLIDYFTPRWRPVQPWVFGEFCESDTFRDLRQLDHRPPTTDHRLLAEDRGLRIEDSGADAAEMLSSIFYPLSSSGRPWWLEDDPERNPQGARWLYEIVAQERRLRANGLWERGAELERISRRQALLHRKLILELVRTYREISGYVVTGEADTPISSAGMWDDGGRLKFDASEFRAFNGDLVVLAGWDRRRAWIAGGDRAAYWDTFSYSAGATVRPHLIASHYGLAHGPAHVTWSLGEPGAEPFSVGAATTPFALAPGSVREVAIAEFVAPSVANPCRYTLHVSVRVSAEIAENAWPLWFFPRLAWPEGVALIDPGGRLRDLLTLSPAIGATLEGATVVIATAWTPELAAFVAAGGRAVLLQVGEGPPGPLPTVALSFWREAIRLCEPHPAWGDFPLDDEAGLQFFGCAADHALDLAAFPNRAAPIFRRLDARTMRLHEYAVEIAWGIGRAIITTLRFEGGQGAQPLGIAHNTAAAYLLRCWITYLASDQSSEPL